MAPSAMPTTTLSSSPPPAAQQVAILTCLILLAIYSQFFRSSIGVIAPNIAADIPMPSDTLGLTSSAFFFVFAVLQIPVGIALDRYGTRHTLTAMLFVAAIGAMVFATASTANDLILGRFLVGFGFTGLMIGAIATLARWYPPLRFASAMALLFACSNAGSLFATLPLAAAAEAWGWRSTFFGLAVISVFLTVAFYAVVRDAPPGHPFHKERAHDSLVEVAKGFGRALRVRNLVYVLPMIAVGYASIITVLGLWGGPFLHDVYSLDAVDRGRVLFAMASTMILGTLAYGPLDRMCGDRRLVVMVGAAGTGAIFLLLGVVPPTSLGITAVLLGLLAFVGAYSVTVMAHGVALFPQSLVGRGVTILHVALNGGTALLQAATGQIMETFGSKTGVPDSSSYAALFLFLGALTVAAVAVYGHIRETAPAAIPVESGD